MPGSGSYGTGYGSGAGLGIPGSSGPVFEPGYGKGSAGTACNYKYPLGVGELTSPSYPYNYPSFRNCQYLIEQPEGATITLEFKDMSIENHRYKENGEWKCRFDFVEVEIRN